MKIVFCETCGTFQDADTWDKVGDCKYRVLSGNEIIDALNAYDQLRELIADVVRYAKPH
jgi:hypothetical protein